MKEGREGEMKERREEGRREGGREGEKREKRERKPVPVKCNISVITLA